MEVRGERTLLKVALHGEHEQFPGEEHDVHRESGWVVTGGREAPDKVPDTAAASAGLGAHLAVQCGVFLEGGLMQIGVLVVEHVLEILEAESCLREHTKIQAQLQDKRVFILVMKTETLKKIDKTKYSQNCR